jgi:Flp pilus assembly pilin Flp
MVAAAIIIAINTIQQHVDAVHTTVKTGMETAGYTNRLVGS